MASPPAVKAPPTNALPRPTGPGIPPPNVCNAPPVAIIISGATVPYIPPVNASLPTEVARSIRDGSALDGFSSPPPLDLRSSSSMRLSS